MNTCLIRQRRKVSLSRTHSMLFCLLLSSASAASLQVDKSDKKHSWRVQIKNSELVAPNAALASMWAEGFPAHMKGAEEFDQTS